MKVKICGIPSLEVAKQVCQLKPDAIGIYIDLHMGGNATSEKISKEIVKIAKDASIQTFFLTYGLDAETIYQSCYAIGNSHVQLIDDIPLEEIEKLKMKLPRLQTVKIISVTGKEVIDMAIRYGNSPAVDQLLLDSRVGNKRGGTGVVHDWNISRQIVQNIKKPVWLAGGIKLHTVKAAIETVQPYGIDVETGVQNPDGSKNYETIKEFISFVHLNHICKPE